MKKADTKAYKHMIIQGIMMNFGVDQQSTTQFFITRNSLDYVFNFIFDNISSMDKDFELKRLIIGLTSLALSETSIQLDQ